MGSPACLVAWTHAAENPRSEIVSTVKSAVLACLLMIAVLTSGCAPSASGAPEELPASPPALLPQASADTRYRAMAKELSGPDVAAERFRLRATATCMKLKGFRFEAEEPAGIDLLEAAGVPEIVVTGAGGHAYKQLVPNPARTALRIRVEKAATEAYQQALTGAGGMANLVQVRLGRTMAGMPREGCQAEGYVATYGTLEDGIRAGGLATSELLKATAPAGRSPKLEEFNSAWLACMAQSGITKYRSPGQAMAAVMNGRVTDEAVDLPSADGKCRQSTGYEEKVWKILDSYLVPLISPAEKEFKQILEIRQRAKK